MKRFAIFGASGFGREVLPLVRQQLLAEYRSGYEVVFVDDNPSFSDISGCPVITYAAWLLQPAEFRGIFIAIADSSIREKIVNRCLADLVKILSVKANNVVVLDDVKIGEGSILCHFSSITSNVVIGKYFHSNIYSYVAHDCVIGDYVTFAPNVHCNGNIVIEDHAYIGTGAILKQGKPGAPLIIGHGAVVGMGAVVTKSVPPGVTVVGNPAKPLIKD